MGLTGQRVLGRAIVVHHAQADKNRHSEKLEQAKKNLMKAGTGPYKIRVDKLHKTVTEEQLKMIMGKLIFFFTFLNLKKLKSHLDAWKRFK